MAAGSSNISINRDILAFAAGDSFDSRIPSFPVDRPTTPPIPLAGRTLLSDITPILALFTLDSDEAYERAFTELSDSNKRILADLWTHYRPSTATSAEEVARDHEGSGARRTDHSWIDIVRSELSPRAQRSSLWGTTTRIHHTFFEMLSSLDGPFLMNMVPLMARTEQLINSEELRSSISCLLDATDALGALNRVVTNFLPYEEQRTIIDRARSVAPFILEDAMKTLSFSTDLLPDYHFGERELYRNPQALSTITTRSGIPFFPAWIRHLEELTIHYQQIERVLEQISNIRMDSSEEDLQGLLRVLRSDTLATLFSPEDLALFCNRIEGWLDRCKKGEMDLFVCKTAIIRALISSTALLYQSVNRLNPLIQSSPIGFSDSLFSRYDALRKAIERPISWAPITSSREVSRSIRILLVTAEFAGKVSTGGLGSYARDLSKTLARSGYSVTVLMPEYGKFSERSCDSIEHRFGRISHRSLYKTSQESSSGINFVTLSGNSCDEIYDVDANTLYQGRHQERFFYFATQVASWVFSNKRAFDIVIVNDWHAAFALDRLKRAFHYEWTSGDIPATIFVVHNNGPGAQGRYDRRFSTLLNDTVSEEFARNDLDDSHVMMRDGLRNADQIVTVSPRYFEEIQADAYGNGLQLDFRQAAATGKFTGILNGFDSDLFDPSPSVAGSLGSRLEGFKRLDGTAIDLSFSSEAPSEIVEKKKMIAKEVESILLSIGDLNASRYGFNLFYTDRHGIEHQRPILFFVGRFDDQKGIDYFDTIIHAAKAQGAACIFMGPNPPPFSPEYGILDRSQELARSMADRDSWGGAVFIRDWKKEDHTFFYQQRKFGKATLGDLIRASASIMVMPSKFEPCGLTQMEGFMCANLVVGMDTGGIHDSITDQDLGRTGFLIPKADDPHSFWQREQIFHTIQRAICTYNDLSKTGILGENLARIIETGRSFDWKRSALENYHHLFIKALQSKRDRRKRISTDATLLED